MGQERQRLNKAKWQVLDWGHKNPGQAGEGVAAQGKALGVQVRAAENEAWV